MTFLPIVARELRVSARRRGSYWIRFAAAIAAALLCAWVILLSSKFPQAAGAATFAVLSVMIFVYAAVAGALATCDCLSEEKREGTLGLLFLTDLKGYDVVLGKLAATSLNTFYGLLATIPALAIPLLMGGVNHDAVWRVALVSLNLLFFFLAVGLFASALCRQDNVALLLAALVGLFTLMFVPMLFWIREVRGHHSDPGLWLVLSPAADCFLVFADFAPTTQIARAFWLNATLTHVFAWCFFLTACLVTPRSWQERFARPKTWRERVSFLFPMRRRRNRAPLLDANPFLWRCARDPFKRSLIWLGPVICAGGWCVLRWLLHDDAPDSATNVLLLLSLNFVLKCWIALEAPRALFEDRRGGGLELLLSTPLSASSIVAGQRLALWRQFGPPIAAVLAAHVWFLLHPAQNDDWSQFIAFVVILAASLPLDSIALSWWAMWLGLRGRRPNRAAILSLAAILVLPTLVFLLFYLTYVIRSQRDNNWLFIGLWGGCGLATDIFFTLRAKKNLRARFAELAANPTAGPRRLAAA